MMFIKYFFKHCPFSFTGSFQSWIFFFSPCLTLFFKRRRRMRGKKISAIGECAELNYALYEKACSEIKRYRRRRAMKISAVGEGAEWK